MCVWATVEIAAVLRANSERHALLITQEMGKPIAEVKLVTSGAGAAALACLGLVLSVQAAGEQAAIRAGVGGRGSGVRCRAATPAAPAEAEAPEPEPVEPISWTVREVVLVHSSIGQTTHRHLMRLPLA